MKIRRFFSLAHRYLGLALLAVLALASVTGSLLAFSHELDRLLNPGLLRVAPPSDGTLRRPLVEQLRSAVAGQSGIDDGLWQASSITPAQYDDEASSVWFRRPDPDRPDKALWAQVLIDPYSAVVLGQRERGRPELSRNGLFHLLRDLHGKLLLGETGRWIMGAAALLWCISSLAGLFLWWPGRRKLKLALTVKRRAGARRFNFDLHRAAGFYSFPLLLAIAFTGIYLALPKTIKPLVARIATLDDHPPPRVAGAASLGAIGPDEAVAIARKIFPDAELKRIGLPMTPRDAYAVAFRQRDEVRRQNGGRSTVWVDPYRGSVLRVDDATRMSAGSTFLNWQAPLHTGSAYGLVGRALVAIAGIVAMVLMATGFLIWWRRKKASEHRTGKT